MKDTIKVFFWLVSETWREYYPKVKRKISNFIILACNFYTKNWETILKCVIIANISLLVLNMGVCLDKRVYLKNTTTIAFSDSITSRDLVEAFMFRVIMADDKVSWKEKTVSPKEFHEIFENLLPEIRVLSKVVANTGIFGRLESYTIIVPEFDDGYGFLPQSQQVVVDAATAKLANEKVTIKGKGL